MGSMLALTIEAILDFAGERSGPFQGRSPARSPSHDGYGTPRELFIAFFAVVRDTLRDLLGDEWSPEIARGLGDQLLVEIDALVAQSQAEIEA